MINGFINQWCETYLSRLGWLNIKTLHIQYIKKSCYFNRFKFNMVNITFLDVKKTYLLNYFLWFWYVQPMYVYFLNVNPADFFSTIVLVLGCELIHSSPAGAICPSCNEPFCDLFKAAQFNPRLTIFYIEAVHRSSPVRQGHKLMMDTVANTIRLWS